MAIDVVIACIDKDLPVLKFCIQSARLFIEDGVDRIFVVAPESAGIAAVCQEERCAFVNENDVFELRRDQIDCRVAGLDRSGWIYKQLLVLAADRISTNEHILILDADTVLIRPHRFLFHGKVTFFASDELHPPYFEAYRKLLKVQWRFPLSFVSHYMLFKRRWLERLRTEIALENQTTWYQAILDIAGNAKDVSFFSEYETYGNFCLFKYPDDILIQYWNNLAMKNSMLPFVNHLIPRFQHSHRAVSFHTYL